jgi:hypothetical protein
MVPGVERGHGGRPESRTRPVLLPRDLSIKLTAYSIPAHDPQTTRRTIIKMGGQDWCAAAGQSQPTSRVPVPLL